MVPFNINEVSHTEEKSMERSITHLVEERIEHVTEEEFDALWNAGVICGWSQNRDGTFEVEYDIEAGLDDDGD